LTIRVGGNGLRVSMGSEIASPADPHDLFGGAVQIGLFHTLAGRESNDPVLLPYDCLESILGHLIRVEKKGSVWSHMTVETWTTVRSDSILSGHTFKLDLTYRPPANKESKLKVSIVVDRAAAEDDPSSTADLFNEILVYRM
jgi:hypothetical protein